MLKKNYVFAMTRFSVQDDGLVNNLKSVFDPTLAYVGFLNRRTGCFYITKDLRNKAYFNISTPKDLQLREKNIKTALVHQEGGDDLFTFHTFCDPKKYYILGLTKEQFDHLDDSCKLQLLYINSAFQLIAGQWVKTNNGWTDKYIPLKVDVEKRENTLRPSD